MRTQIPRARLTVFLVAMAAAGALFLYLNNTFGGPTLIPSSHTPYRLRAVFPDSQNLVKKSLVMYRGFQVGEVDSVSIVHGRADVSFIVYPQYAPLPAGTIVQVDHRTFLQEAFVNLYPGSLQRPRLASGATVRSIPTVEPDDALQVFDPRTRRLLDEGTQTLARGLRAPDAGHEVNATISGLDQVLGGIHSLVLALHGQEGAISQLVTSSATVLGSVATAQHQLSHLIGSGRLAAQTFAAQSTDLGSGIDELNRLLAATHALLPGIRPLLTAATPVLRHATATAHQLTPTLRAIAPVVTSARETALQLEPSSRAAASAFASLLGAEPWLLPLTRTVLPSIEDVVPLLGYIKSQLPAWEAFIANTSDTLNHGDALGPWFQGFLDGTAGGLLGTNEPCDSPLGLCRNPYPSPGDAANPQPYRPGSYPRLVPYLPR